MSASVVEMHWFVANNFFRKLKIAEKEVKHPSYDLAASVECDTQVRNNASAKPVRYCLKSQKALNS